MKRVADESCLPQKRAKQIFSFLSHYEFMKPAMSYVDSSHDTILALELDLPPCHLFCPSYGNINFFSTKFTVKLGEDAFSVTVQPERPAEVIVNLFGLVWSTFQHRSRRLHESLLGGRPMWKDGPQPRLYASTRARRIGRVTLRVLGCTYTVNAKSRTHRLTMRFTAPVVLAELVCLLAESHTIIDGVYTVELVATLPAGRSETDMCAVLRNVYTRWMAAVVTPDLQRDIEQLNTALRLSIHTRAGAVPIGEWNHVDFSAITSIINSA